MSRKIEEIFNLPSVNDAEEFSLSDESDTDNNLTELRTTLEIADKIDQALPAVRDLDTLDKDMDDYAQKAMNAFKDLMDLGQNVEDRHAAAVFDVASKMMTNAITAKTAKMDKKLKMIELQMRKRKLDLEEKKAEIQLAKMNEEVDDSSIEGEAQEFDRNSLINEVIAKVKQNKDF
jgi:hypothetical protein